MVILDDNTIRKCSEKIKSGMIAALLPFTVSLVFCVVICFFLHEDFGNADIIHTIDVIVATLAGWYALSVMLSYVIPNVKRKKAVGHILSGEQKKVRGIAVVTDNIITVRQGLRAREYQITTDEKKVMTCYVDLECDQPLFKTGDLVMITVKSGFIIGYEVVSNEKEI